MDNSPLHTLHAAGYKYPPYQCGLATIILSPNLPYARLSGPKTPHPVAEGDEMYQKMIAFFYKKSSILRSND